MLLCCSIHLNPYSCFARLTDLCALQSWQISICYSNDCLLDHAVALAIEQGLQSCADTTALHVSQHWICDRADANGREDTGNRACRRSCPRWISQQHLVAFNCRIGTHLQQRTPPSPPLAELGIAKGAERQEQLVQHVQPDYHGDCTPNALKKRFKYQHGVKETTRHH